MLVGLLIGAAASATADASSQSSTLIRPGRSIGKFALGMSEQQLRRAAGRPSYVIPRGRASLGQRIVEWQYGRGADYVVRLIGRPGRMHVSFVSTTLRRERTPQRIGPGSLERSLRGAYPAIRCGPLEEPPPPGAPPDPTPYVSNDRDCTLFASNGARTIFRSSVTGKRYGVTAEEFLRRATVVEAVLATRACRRWRTEC